MIASQLPAPCTRCQEFDLESGVSLALWILPLSRSHRQFAFFLSRVHTDTDSRSNPRSLSSSPLNPAFARLCHARAPGNPFTHSEEGFDPAVLSRPPASGLELKRIQQETNGSCCLFGTEQKGINLIAWIASPVATEPAVVPFETAAKIDKFPGRLPVVTSPTPPYTTGPLPIAPSHQGTSIPEDQKTYSASTGSTTPSILRTAFCGLPSVSRNREGPDHQLGYLRPTRYPRLPIVGRIDTRSPKNPVGLHFQACGAVPVLRPRLHFLALWSGAALDSQRARPTAASWRQQQVVPSPGEPLRL